MAEREIEAAGRDGASAEQERRADRSGTLISNEMIVEFFKQDCCEDSNMIVCGRARRVIRQT